MRWLRDNVKLLIAFVLLLGLLLARHQVRQLQLWLSSARFDTKPQIPIFISATSRPFTDFWRFLAQGGEEPGPMLKPTLSSLNQLKPRYIRLDHLFDAYDLVQVAPDGRLTLDWTKLDQAVDEILSVQAKPVLVLSYFPPSLTREGTVTGTIKDWTNWRFLVNQTITHFSGRRGIKDVIYEVWNEPDLFGRFGIGGKKDYRELYRQTIVALPSSETVQPFFIGGPAITHANYRYLKGFLKYIKANNLRLDFISYHAYHQRMSKFVDEIVKVRRLAGQLGVSRPIYVTEWGIDGDLNPAYDTVAGYNHLINSVVSLAPYVLPDDKFFVFEIKDGPPPQPETIYWGRWGLFTHETVGLRAKPRWQALNRLAQLPWDRLMLVEDLPRPLTGLITSSVNKDKIGIVLVNNSPRLIQPTLNLRFVPNGQWRLISWQGFNYQDVEVKVVNNHTLDLSLNLLPNSNALLVLKQQDDYTRAPGRFGYPGDYALSLTQPWRVELGQVLPKPALACRFWFKYTSLPDEPAWLYSLNSLDRQLIGLKWGYDGFEFGLQAVTGLGTQTLLISQDKFKTDNWYLVNCRVVKTGFNYKVRFEVGDQIIETSTALPTNYRRWHLEFPADWRLSLDDLVIYNPDSQLITEADQPLDDQLQNKVIWRYDNFDILPIGK